MSVIRSIFSWLSTADDSGASKIQQQFGVEVSRDADLDAWISECLAIYQGNPSWIDTEDDIDSINFAKTICSEVARLATLGIGVHIDGSGRAEWLQRQIDKVYYQLRHWVEYGCAGGTIILKPNGNTIDMYRYGQFDIVSTTNGEIEAVIFHNVQKSSKAWYKRYEYHRFEDGVYKISNRCFRCKSRNDEGEPVSIEATPWAELAEDLAIRNIDKPLFGVLRMPQANNIAPESAYGLPTFSEAVQELRDLDIAYSRFAAENLDSKRTVLLDSDMMLPSGTRIASYPAALENQRISLKLPKAIKNVQGKGTESFYQEINPNLNTEIRLAGINALLSQIGYKCGFANGYFVFNKSAGILTATQVEADQQRTIQTIKDVRDKLESCLDNLVRALDVLADLYKLAPKGSYEITYDFSDITYNFEEERQHYYQLAMAGHYPWEEYYVRFLGYSHEDAKALLKQAKDEQRVPTLFGGKEE